jgi:uncharacterized membrane protein
MSVDVLAVALAAIAVALLYIAWWLFRQANTGSQSQDLRRAYATVTLLSGVAVTIGAYLEQNR